MIEYDMLLMSLVVFMPAIFAIALMFIPRGMEETMRWVCLIGTAVTLALSLVLFIDYIDMLYRQPVTGATGGSGSAFCACTGASSPGRCVYTTTVSPGSSFLPRGRRLMRSIQPGLMPWRRPIDCRVSPWRATTVMRRRPFNPSK